jgi:radical SAM protein with 4Fe4S-binding SPASM domain
MPTALEFTMQIGCRVNCKKYCPQELIVGNYSGTKNLTLENFKKMLRTVPPTLTINFSGFCEPFLNPETPLMMMYAHNRGHPIDVYTTLVGLEIGDALMIADIPFNYFKLHLPDSYGNANIPTDVEYFSVLDIILHRVANIAFMSMNGLFQSNCAEERVRGNAVVVKPGKVTCDRLDEPNFVVQPNGEVYFCCMTRGLSNRIGNLLDETYMDIERRHPSFAREMRNSPDSICHRCSWSYPKWLDYARASTKKCAGAIEWLRFRL